jgi:serine protease Do
MIRLLLLLTITWTNTSSASTLAELEQAALHAAVQRVAPAVVQIRTVGGLDRIGKTLLAQGPTTGLIIAPEGYIVSSAINFVNQPSSILVRLADGQQLPAQLVSRDRNRMLVLLKVEAKEPLPVALPAPQSGMRVGQWAIAVGRTFQTEQVDVSVGILSALHRKYGRVLQTDASLSTANYGGPLVDISGQVLGVLVPMSTQDSGGEVENELSSSESYDSGIGFAVPLEHVLERLPRWQQGEELRPGKLGVALAAGDVHTTPPTLLSIWPHSPAAQAGWQAQDLITAVDGVSVATQAALRFQVLPRYAGDTLEVTLQRGAQVLQTRLTLAAELTPYRPPFLGILPSRVPSAEPGVRVRQVWPDSPAQQAGVAAGDRITKINTTRIESITEALTVLAGLHPGETATLLVERGQQPQSVSAQLTTQPAVILAPEDFPAPASPPAALPEPTLEKLLLPEFSQVAVAYTPPHPAQQRLGLLLWLGEDDPAHQQALLDAWQATCQQAGLHLLIAPPAQPGAWSTEDLPYVQQLLRVASMRLGAEPRRTVLGGQDKAGQLAYAVALQTTLAGVIGIDAPLPRTLQPPALTPKNRLSLLIVESQNSTFAPLIRRDLKLLRKAGYPTSWLPSAVAGRLTPTLDPQTRASVARWIDGLDRF